MELEFSISEDQLRQVASNFERPTRPLMRSIADYLYGRSRTAFARQTAPDGTPWAALSPKYAERKPKDKRTKRTGILQQSGQLVDSLSVEATDTTAIIRTNRPVGNYSLGAIHQFGAPRRNIPARPFMPMTEQGDLLPEDIEEINALIADYFAL